MQKSAGFGKKNINILFILSLVSLHSSELQVKQDKKASNDRSEKLKIVSDTNITTEEALLNKLLSKNVLKTKKVNVTGGMFIYHEKELDESNQTVINYGISLRDNQKMLMYQARFSKVI